MGKKSGGVPPAPDPKKVAAEQSKANVDAILASAKVNRFNEITPYGSVIWGKAPNQEPKGTAQYRLNGPNDVKSSGNRVSPTYDFEKLRRIMGARSGVDNAEQSAYSPVSQGGISDADVLREAKSAGVNVDYFSRPGSQPTAPLVDDRMGLLGGLDKAQRTTTLSESGQKQLDQRNLLAETLGKYAIDQSQYLPKGEFNLDGLPDAPVANDEARKRYEDALYQRYTSRLDPRFDLERKAIESRLANQGLMRGSEAYNEALNQFGRTKNDAYDQAARESVIYGGSEMANLFGLEANARDRALRERLMERSQPFNEISAILQGSPAISMPAAAPAAQYQVAPPDIMGATYNNYAQRSAAARQAAAARSQLMGSLIGAGGSIGAAFLSDKDKKTNIKPAKGVVEALMKVPNSTYQYKGSDEPRIGPMAQDWAKQFGGDGKTIPMPQAFGLSLAAINELGSRVKRLESA